ncbi:reverse transcriptase domain-containing protein [Tanacetum coccineum]
MPCLGAKLRTPSGGTSTIAGQAQGCLSPAFVKENINVLRTMIKDLDNRGQEKVTPRKLFNEESGEARSENSQMSPSAEEVRGYSFDGSSRSRSRGRLRSTRKHRKSVSRKKGISMSHRSVRSEARSRSKSKSVKSKPYLYPKSVDGFEELSNKFLEEFSQQKSHPEIAKNLNDKIRKIVDEMWERVKAFIRVETFADTTEKGEGRSMGTCAPYATREGFIPLTKTPKKILTMDNVNFPPPPPMIEEAVASGRLAHLVKDIRQSGQKSKGSAKGKVKVINMVRYQGYQKGPYEKIKHWMDNAIAFPSVPRYQLMDYLVVVDALIEGFRVRRIRVDGGEVNYPLGVIDLEVNIGEYGKTRTIIMEFAVVKSPSPYNVLLGRTGMRSLGAVASTIHSMIKFLTLNEITTIATTRETLKECRQIEEAQALSRHALVTDPSPMQTSSEVTNPRVSLAPMETRSRRPGKEPMQLDDMEERRKLDKGKKLPKSSVEEKIMVNDNYPEQLVTIGGSLSAECRHALIHTLRKNVDIFAWTLVDMTGIPRVITEHSLDTYPHIEQKLHKKRSIALDRRNARMCIDFKDLNKACPKDLYLLPEIEWKIELLMGFQYKYFLDAYKGYQQIQMTKKDEEKTAFHTEEGVFYYTKMPFGLKNAGVTYQRLVDSAFKEQIGVNLEAYVDDMKCSFGMEEGKFLGYIVTSEGIRANPEKTKVVMDMPSPRTLKQMQSLSFRWTKAAEAVFLEIKKLVSELPTLTTLKKGASRRLGKWAIELGAYGITYVPRVAIKGQVLADFLADTSTEINATPEVGNTPRIEDIIEYSNARENLTPGPRA